jgi:hypothetical protein
MEPVHYELSPTSESSWDIVTADTAVTVGTIRLTPHTGQYAPCDAPNLQPRSHLTSRHAAHSPQTPVALTDENVPTGIFLAPASAQNMRAAHAGTGDAPELQKSPHRVLRSARTDLQLEL